jgi:peptide chain release factor 1
MKSAMRAKLEQLAERKLELDRLLGEPDVAGDLQRYRALAREHADLAGPVALYERHRQAERDLAEARALLAEAADDPALADMAREELEAAQALLPQIEAQLERDLLPKDPDDARDAFLEIRAGTGGEESALFAADLLRMYLRYAERHGLRSEIVSQSASDLKGYKEVIVKLSGDGVYGRLKFESGGHRVQRVPETEAQGRIHTSACTVAVLADPGEAAAVQINPADLRIDTFRASGAGGQHVNKTDSAIRITHLPTGLVVECQDDRSQHRNKAQALSVLAARLKERERRARHEKEAAERRSLIGSGDRSDRIRTYNFPQGRMTDHRINLTLYKLGFIMDGDLDEVIDALQAADLAERLAALEGAAA